MKGTNALGAAAVAAALLVAGGCGSASEKIAEKATEKALEQGAGGDVDIDLDGDGGSFTLEGGDGEKVTYEADGDGNVKISGGGEDGTDFTIGDGSELPDGWPEELAPPKGMELESSMSSSDGMMVSGRMKGDAEEIFTDLKERLEDEGYEVMYDNFTRSAETGDVGSLSAEGDHNVTLSVMELSSEDGVVTVSISVAEATG